MRKVDGLRGRGEAPDAKMDTGGSRETSEGRVIRYFDGGKGAAATVIRKAWRGQGRGGWGGD